MKMPDVLRLILVIQEEVRGCGSLTILVRTLPSSTSVSNSSALVFASVSISSRKAEIISEAKMRQLAAIQVHGLWLTDTCHKLDHLSFLQFDNSIFDPDSASECFPTSSARCFVSCWYVLQDSVAQCGRSWRDLSDSVYEHKLFGIEDIADISVFHKPAAGIVSYMVKLATGFYGYHKDAPVLSSQH